MIFAESENFMNEFKALSRGDFESDDKLLKIKRENYIRQLVRDIFFNKNDVESYFTGQIFNEENILVFLEHLSLRVDKLTNLNVKEISKFNSIFEKISVKIIQLITEKKLDEDQLENLAEILNKEKLLKVFLKAFYNWLNDSKEKLDENFCQVFGALINVFTTIFKENPNLINNFKIHFVDNFLLDFEHLKNYDYTKLNYGNADKISINNESSESNLQKLDSNINRKDLENKIQNMFYSFLQISSENSLERNNIFYDFKHYIKTFFEKYNIQIEKSQLENLNKNKKQKLKQNIENLTENSLLNKKRGRDVKKEIDEGTVDCEIVIEENLEEEQFKDNSKVKEKKKAKVLGTKIAKERKVQNENKNVSNKRRNIIIVAEELEEEQFKDNSKVNEKKKTKVLGTKIAKERKVQDDNKNASNKRRNNIKVAQELEETLPTKRISQNKRKIKEASGKSEKAQPLSVSTIESPRKSSRTNLIPAGKTKNKDNIFIDLTSSDEIKSPSKSLNKKIKTISHPNSSAKKIVNKIPHTPELRKSTRKISEVNLENSYSKSNKSGDKRNKSEEKSNLKSITKSLQIQLTPIKTSPKANSNNTTSQSPKRYKNQLLNTTNIIGTSSNLTFKNLRSRSASSNKSSENNLNNSANSLKKNLSKKRQQITLSPSQFDFTPVKNLRRSSSDLSSNKKALLKYEEEFEKDSGKKSPKGKKSSESKSIQLSFKNHSASSKRSLRSAGSKTSEIKEDSKLLNRKRQISFRKSSVAEFNPATPVKEMKSKIRVDSNQKLLTPISKSILNKKNLILNESSIKKKSGKAKKIQVQIRNNTRANSKINKKLM